MATSGLMQGEVANPVAAQLEGGARSRWVLGAMLGRSPAMERLFLQMRYLAGHLRVATIEGERGTGKRLVAETLHGLGPMRGERFLAAEAAEFLAGTEMPERLQGLAGGTLYLAGVDSLDGEGQLRLLHLLDWVRGAANGQRAPGALATERGLTLPHSTPPHVLLVSARRPLRALALYGRFRTDLQQQLLLVKLCLPPLRERREDVKLLAEAFAAKAAGEAGRECPSLSREALAALMTRAWAGNVAELGATVRAATARAGDRIGVEHLGIAAGGSPIAAEAGQERYAALQPRGRSIHIAPSPRDKQEEAAARRARTGLVEQHPPRVSMTGVSTRAYEESFAESRLAMAPAAAQTEDLNLDRAIVRHIRMAMAKVNGNKLQASRLLGISRSTLYRLLEGPAARSVPAVPQQARAASEAAWIAGVPLP